MNVDPKTYIAKNEGEVEQLIALDAVQYGCVLMRNNSGAFEDKEGRLVRFGLDNTSAKRNEKIKSSDRIGFTRVTITEEMVGQTVAIFTAIEIKKPGWIRNLKDARENAQEAFTNWVKACGGFAGFAQSIHDFRRIIGR